MYLGICVCCVDGSGACIYQGFYWFLRNEIPKGHEDTFETIAVFITLIVGRHG